ncbi:unnamed protein product [Brassica oleracea var. botrytis]
MLYGSIYYLWISMLQQRAEIYACGLISSVLKALIYIHTIYKMLTLILQCCKWMLCLIEIYTMVKCTCGYW